MERRLRLLDHVYRKNDPKRIEGKIISAEEDGGNETKFIVFFPGEVNYYYYFESELCLCSDTVDTIFSKSLFQQHPFQQSELSSSEIQYILDNEMDNSTSRRSLWYDILFYKRSCLPKQSKCISDSKSPVDPVVLRLLKYPVPDEIRCFLWSEFLSVPDSYVIGYYSIIRNKQFGIPANSLSVIEADLRRMEISSAEHRQMLRLLTSIYLHDSKMGYVQGMHFLAHLLLTIFSEEEAFFVFIRIVEFLPPKYYNFYLEGINTDLLVIAALMNKLDPYFYSSMEHTTENMIFFLSPVYKWLVDLFSNPFALPFSYRLLDVLFSFGNWSLAVAPLAIILERRKEFILSKNMEEITSIFADIATSMKNEEIPRVINSVYELCILADINGINEFREELRNESNLHNRISSEGAEVDEQNGVVADLCKDNSFHSSYSHELASSDPSTKLLDTNSIDMKLSYQLSMHMRRISSSLKRVNGVTDSESRVSEGRSSLHNSLDVIGIDRLPSFNDFSECVDDEADYDPWRDSVMDDESVPFEAIRGSLENPGSMDRDSIIVTHDVSEVEVEAPESETIVQSPLKWNQGNLLFKKVFKLYDEIRNQRQYNVTSNSNEGVGNGRFLLEREIRINSEYLDNYFVVCFD